MRKPWQKIRWMIAILLLGGPVCAMGAEALFTPPPADQILKTLKPGHPRLIIDHTTVPHIRDLIATDTVAARCYRRVKRSANRTLKQAPSEYKIPDGRRLLSVSRRVKERVRTLAFVYLMEGDRRYVDRAWQELEAASKFKDWNPSHFLDTAEMTYAFATGYDWLYHEWTPEQRTILKTAIVTLGLEPGIKVYKRGRGWVRGHNNWNQVCNGGLGAGGLAIADEAPELATEILHHGIQSLPLAMSYYAPDGAGAEGVTYWSYGARYNILFLSALETALDTDFGLSQIPGFKESGDYQLYISGASGRAFNFADCGLSRMSTPMHFWMGKKFNIPRYSWFRYSELQKPRGRGSVLDLLWFDNMAKTFDSTVLPPDKRFGKVDVASMRSGWNDPAALVLGIQAGGNMNLRMHRHLDQGTFILEALGERWVIDSGTERETYQRHRNKEKRWAFYRIRAEGHNTLVLNPEGGPDQDPGAACAITKFESTRKRTTAVVDLTEAYATHASRVQRTFELIDRSYVTITDEIVADNPAEAWWFMHTQANVELSPDKTAATLHRGAKQLVVEIVSPPEAGFTVMAARPLPTSPDPDVQNKNEGRRKLAIWLPNVRTLKLTVKLTPMRGGRTE